MFHYRVYLLDQFGKIFHGEDIQALDTEGAVSAAHRLLENHNANHQETAYGVEIWLDRNLIYNSSSNSD